MSLESVEIIDCPKCGKSSEFTIWQSLNTVLNPEMKAKVMDGSIFKFTCPHCQEVTNIQWDFVYHQMDDCLMINLCTEDDVDEQIATIDHIRNDGFKELGVNPSEGYTNRIVTSQNDLREKIFIFDAGLDDHVIEMMKMYMIGVLNSNNPDMNINGLLLEIEEDNVPRSFAVFNDRGYLGSTEYAQDLYDGIKESIVDKIDISDDDYLIDQNWAYENYRRLKNK
ncbi:CpXC protein [Pseudobutyrivibrio ruminis]|uniref:CpXC protein n=1 Tax=Pseudobutyrivibrio ruminis TaxID=46206 RepID=A0A1H7G7I0_9FIRM|nr:CpXC domain-containing protein [Pseudobutyrivibrio ruminis]SEK34078.1 CpXC protein [Pseudobutyrivibrio ruminis]